MKNITLFCCALMIAAALQAQIIHVPGDYTTIQQGIEAANPGDTVLVNDGIYYEQINFLGKKPLMVASQFLMDGDTSHISKYHHRWQPDCRSRQCFSGLFRFRRGYDLCSVRVYNTEWEWDIYTGRT